jgi:3-keto-5-aminohexanoate cleavage enzyme
MEGAMEKVIITAAVTGSRPTKEMNPAVPYTPMEIAREVVECYRAGAAIAHIHVRNPETGAPASDPELFREVLERIREKCDILINFTTSGLDIHGPGTIEKRLRPVMLNPDLCSLDVGSMNFHDRPFLNPPAWGEVAAERMLDGGVKPEMEIFEVGHIGQAMDLIQKGLIAEPPYFQLCMGVGWGMPATAENFLFLRSKLPPGARWSVMGVGRTQLKMITLGILMGGNIRVGFEDNLYLRKGELAKGNAAFVEKGAELANCLQREVATVAEARRILNLGS